NRHVDFLKRDIIKAMNKAAALDELIKGHPSTESRWPACHVSETKTGFTLPKSVRIRSQRWILFWARTVRSSGKG
ncbi:hypothetical protein R8B00_26135, partial [Escherichia coli]|nr:hypothetical protein [Escherichia coli]